MAGPSPPTLARFVPRVAADWETDAPGTRWREQDGTLCFVDISGFTALSERLAMRGRVGVEELTDVLNRVFGTMLDLAFERGGSLLKFGGDALLLLFDGDDHPRQAAAAAVEMRAALRTATSAPMSVGRVQLRMSIGLHSGPVQLFRVGTLHHELIVTGPAATRTTQMEHAASAGEILVSPEMAARLPAGATRPGPPGTEMLRWRRAPTSPPGPRVRRPASSDAVERCLPAILREHLRPGAADFQHRIAAVGFIRFRGVDDVFASAGPDAVGDALHAVVSRVQVEAEQAGVTFLASDIDEDGGKIILTSGVPSAQADHQGRILRVLRAVADADLPLPLHIGVNDGHVFAGTIGAAHRATYTVMGDTVNLAARLMAAAPPGELYAAPGVLDRARPLFATRALVPFAVKGKAAPVQAFAVDAEVGDRTTDAHQGPFVGRDEERRSLVEALQSREVVTVVGPTGVGKSRLVNEAISATGMDAVVVRGEPDGTTSPYRAVRDPLRALLGIERGDPALMAQQLTEVIRRLEPSLLPLLPLLGSVTHVEVPPTPESASIEARFLPARRAAVVRQVLELVLPPRVVIVVEDAQWTDGASKDLLDRLVEAIPHRRPGWAVVVVRRTQPGGFSPASPRLEVAPMGDADLRELLLAVSTVPLRPDEVAHLVGRAAGSPLVLHALARLGRDRGAVDDLPDSLEALIAAEVDVLPPFSRMLLGYASVLGRSFQPHVWRELLGHDGIELEGDVSAELQRFVEFDPSGGARFRDAVVREVVYRGLPYRRRRELHLRAGQVLEAGSGGEVDEIADVLSLHFFEGGEPERAWRYGLVAGSKAQAGYANVDAAAQYRRALEAGRRVGAVPPEEVLATWTALGDVLEQAGLLDEALGAYRRAVGLAGDDDVRRGQLILRRARVRERSGAFVTALRELRSAERAVAALDSPDAARLRVAAATLRAIVHEGQEQPRRALRAAEAAAAEAERVGDLRELASAYNVIDWAHVVLGEPDRAVHQLRIIEIHEALGEPHRAASALGNHGAVQFWRGSWDDALDSYRRAHDAYASTGDVVNAAVQQANIAELLINRGDLAAARSHAEEAAQTHRAVGFIDGALFDEVQLGRLRAASGDDAGAAALLGAVYAEAQQLGLHGTALDAAIALAECDAVRTDARDSMEILAEAEERAGDDAAVLEPAIALARTRSLLRRGDAAEARRHREAGIEAARRLGLRYELGLLLVLDGDVEDQAEGRGLLDGLGVAAPVSG